MDSQIPLKKDAPYPDDASGPTKMKKFYPEDYFRRSGYKMDQPVLVTDPSQPRVTSAMNGNMEVERFNEELIYP